MTAEIRLGPVQGLHLALSSAAVAAGLVLASPRFAASLALGALLEAVNFRSLRRAAEGLLHGGGTGLVVGGFGLRFVLLAAAVGVALHQGAHPVGLVIGLSLIVPAVLVSAWRARPRDAWPLQAGSVPPPDDPSWDEWNPWTARPRERDPDAEDDEA